MKRLHRHQRGEGHVILVLGVLVVAAIALAGYRVVHTTSNVTTASTSDVTSTSVQAVAIPARIQSKADLEQATQALDSDQINSSMDPSQLNSDLNSLL